MEKYKFKHLIHTSILSVIIMGITACNSSSGPGSKSVNHQQIGLHNSRPVSEAIQNSARPTRSGLSRANHSTSESSTTAPNRTTSIKVHRKEYSPSDLFAKYNSAVFIIYTSDGNNGAQGSGFFISDDGLAVSNYHVFKGMTKGYESIKLTNDMKYKVEEVISYNDEKDYILFRVKLDGTKVNYIPVSNIKPKVGEKAYAIGSPRGLENTFSSGEISQIRHNDIFQISVPIDHGSSGGALLNSYGEVIGITTSGYDDSGANLNFAMSIDVIKDNL